MPNAQCPLVVPSVALDRSTPSSRSRPIELEAQRRRLQLLWGRMHGGGLPPPPPPAHHLANSHLLAPIDRTHRKGQIDGFTQGALVALVRGLAATTTPSGQWDDGGRDSSCSGRPRPTGPGRRPTSPFGWDAASSKPAARQRTWLSAVVGILRAREWAPRLAAPALGLTAGTCARRPRRLATGACALGTNRLSRHSSRGAHTQIGHMGTAFGDCGGSMPGGRRH
jgi:hypothetical protein